MKTKTPDSLTIQQYLEGKLDPEAAHQLEKEALDDPFLWDALEGYSVYRDPAEDLSILQRQLHERIVHLQENKKVFDLTWQRLSVAAAAAVMFVSAGILFWMNTQKSPDRLASQSQKPVEVNVIDKDSVEALIQSDSEPVIASLEKKEPDRQQQTVSANKPTDLISKKAIISPKAESTIAASSASVHQPVESQAMAAASDMSNARQTKVARLGDDKGALNEIVVTGYENAPKSGWIAYQEYLDLNTRKFKTETPAVGSVLLSFQVGSDGKLSNITVLKGINQAYNKEAMRIVRDGSDWTPAPAGKTYESRVEISFK